MVFALAEEHGVGILQLRHSAIRRDPDTVWLVHSSSPFHFHRCEWSEKRKPLLLGAADHFPLDRGTDAVGCVFERVAIVHGDIAVFANFE